MCYIGSGIISVHLLGIAVGNDHAAGHSAMAEKGCKTGKCAGLHLEVADLHAVILERLNLLVLVRITNSGTQLTSLRSVEAATGNGIALDHVVAGNLVDEVLICYCNIRCTLDGVPLHVFLECFFHLEVTHIVTSCVVVQQSVKANAFNRSDEAASGGEGLQTAAGTDTYHCERAVLGLLFTGVVVDICQRVELVGYDVNVVTPDTVALGGDALALIGTCNGVELAA